MKTSILLLFLLILTNSFGQDLSTYSIDELNKQKQTAIQNENYELANSIKLELDRRASFKTNAELIEEAKTKLNEAVKEENFEAAAEIKKEIEIREAIEKAIKEENYSKATELKAQLTNSNETITDNPIENTDIKTANTEENQPTPAVTTPKSTTVNVPSVFTPKKPFAFNKISATLAIPLCNIVFNNNGEKTRYNTGVGLYVTAAGVFNLVEFNEKMNMEFFLGLGYQRFSCKYDEYEVNYRFHYVPIFFGTSINLGGPTIKLGLSNDIMISGKQWTGSSISNAINVLEEDAIKRLNTSLLFGFGYSFKFSEMFFEYKQGIINIEGKDTVDGERTKTNAIIIGYRHHFKPKK